MPTAESRNLTFDRVVCVNLDRRGDRWDAFRGSLPALWPFGQVQRIRAVDGQLCPPPKFWKQGAGAWGCYRSHVRILEDAIHDGLERILIFEDDAVFAEDFAARAVRYLRHVPADADLIYLGGQHIQQAKGKPKYVNDHVYRAYNVNRTHAFAVCGREFMQRFYKHLHRWENWPRGHHIDHHIGSMVAKGEAIAYCPAQWLVAQAAGVSDISRKHFLKDRLYNHARDAAPREAEKTPFVAVLGLHSAGTSCTAGVLHHLGIHLGNRLGGYYGRDPERLCGFEAAGLATICEDAIGFPRCEQRVATKQVTAQLKRWIAQRRREAAAKRTLAGGKYPLLCRLGEALIAAAGREALRVIDVRRPIEESIESIRRRCPKRDSQQLAAHQQWLDEGRTQFLATLAPEQIHTVHYHELLASPAEQIDRLAAFLAIKPTALRRNKAIAYVDPAQRHVG